VIVLKASSQSSLHLKPEVVISWLSTQGSGVLVIVTCSFLVAGERKAA